MDYINNYSLEGKVALITGASYGIGFAIAKAMAGAGATIVFNDIKQELVDKGVAAYAEIGIKAHGYVCDVTNEDAVNAMVAQIENEVGVVDILVNNAGIIKRIPMIEMSAKDFRQVIDVDLNAPFIVSKAVIPSMIKKGHGKIINICSMMSEFGRETVSAYAAAKGGLKMLTRNICSEYGEHNIQCNGIGPGYIATPQTAPLREKQADGSRHHPCKVPAAHEPVLLPDSDIVLAVAGMDALGRPLAQACQRPQLAAELLGCNAEKIIDAQMLVSLLLSEQGARKNVGARAYYIVLNKCDLLKAAQQEEMLRLLVGAGMDEHRIWLRERGE